MKTDNEDHLVVDILEGNESRHKEIIDKTIGAESQAGVARIANKTDLIWLKRFRNSDQDKVDIRKLEDDQDRKNYKSD